MRCDQRVDQVLSLFQHGFDLTTSTAAHGFSIECLPQIVDTASSGSSSGINQHANVGLQHLAESLKEPSMRIDLLLILLLEAEQDLHRSIALLHPDNALLDLQRHLCGVLVDVCRDIFTIDLLLCNTVLVDSHCCEHGSCSRVDLCTSIRHDTHDNLLPSLLSPRLGRRPRVHVLDILDHTNQRPREQLILLVVHCNDNEQLGLARLRKQALSQGEAFLAEFAGIARRSTVSHMCEFVSFWWLRVLNLIEQSRRDRTVQHQIAVE